MKTLAAFVFAFLAISATAQIGAKTQQNEIHGVWQNNSFGYQMTLMLNTDGTGEFDGESIKYIAKDNKFAMTIVAESQTINYNYNLQGNSLVVSGGDLEVPVTFTRNGSANKPTSSNTKPSNSNTNSNSNSNLNTDKNLIGLWSGNGEAIEFTPAGQCNYVGQTYSYQILNGQVILHTQQGNLMMAYSVKGNVLSLTINGQTIQYTKGAVTTPQNISQGSAAGKRVAQELVGKWCYINVNTTNSGGSSSDECITLKTDGSYEYYRESSRSVNTNAYSGGTNSQGSDRGTWTYDGAKIYYTSSSGAGSGSYTLEKKNHPKNNDPMIVLDGKTYVTFYQKAPWR
jgi:hypothetical protein